MLLSWTPNTKSLPFHKELDTLADHNTNDEDLAHALEFLLLALEKQRGQEEFKSKHTTGFDNKFGLSVTEEIEGSSALLLGVLELIDTAEKAIYDFDATNLHKSDSNEDPWSSDYDPGVINLGIDKELYQEKMSRCIDVGADDKNYFFASALIEENNENNNIYNNEEIEEDKEAEIEDEINDSESISSTISTDEIDIFEQDLQEVDSTLCVLDTNPSQNEMNNERQLSEEDNDSMHPDATHNCNDLGVYVGADSKNLSYFNLRVIYEPQHTGLEFNTVYTPPIDSMVAGRYKVKKELDTAAFSTAYLCEDLMTKDGEQNQKVCLKVIKYGHVYFHQSLDEVKVLQFLNAKADVDKNHLIRMHDFFFYKERLIIATELLDENLYTLGQRLSDNNLPKYFILPRLKLVTKQILEALVCVHELNIIHCDIKPENVLIKSHGECSIKLIDFGSSCFCGDVQMTYIQSRSYRAPDVILGHRYDGRIDVWSLAAMVAELHTGSVLFQNESIQGMLARIHAILGPIPQDVLSRCEIAHKYYTKFGVVYHEEDEDCSLIYPILTDLRTRLKFNVTAEQKHGRSKMREKMIEKTGKDGVYNVEDVVHNKDETYGEDGLTMDERLYIDFVRHMLTLDPLLRPTAKEALQHPWLADTDKIDLSKINESTPWR